MADPIVNFFKSTLVGTYSNSATSLTIATGDGALLPDPSVDGAFNLTIFEGLQVTNSTSFEIVRVTARSGDVLTVTRGAESTTPLTIGSSTHSILMSATKKTFDDINNAIDNVDLTTLTGVEELTFDSTGDEEFGLPAGTTAQRPASPSAGYMRWNSTDSRIEVYNGSRWAGLSEIGLEQVSLGVAQLSVTANDAEAGIPFGTAWATTSALNVASAYLGSAGSTSSALKYGGVSTVTLSTTEKWNGTSWATTSSLNTIRSQPSSFGTSNDALVVGGSSGSNLNSVEIWATSSWATTTVYPQSNYGSMGVGSVSDGLNFGGYTTAYVSTTYKWNGSAWSSTSSLNSPRYDGSKFGDASSAITSEGLTTGDSYVSTTEKWNGSTWATTSSSTTSGAFMGSNNTGTLGISFAGQTPSYINTSRIWNGSVWATTSNYGISAGGVGGVGTHESALGFGGTTGASITNSYLWS